MIYTLFKQLKRAIPKCESYFNRRRGADASAGITAENVVVLKGSTIASSETTTTPQSFRSKRKKLMSDDIVKNYILIKEL